MMLAISWTMRNQFHSYHCTKNETADLVTFTEEILNGVYHDNGWCLAGSIFESEDLLKSNILRPLLRGVFRTVSNI